MAKLRYPLNIVVIVWTLVVIFENCLQSKKLHQQMEGIIRISVMTFLFTCCSTIKNSSTIALEGQRWSFSRQISPGIGGGNTWIFLSKNSFTEESWYSGGAYWTHHYGGTYKYDAESKTVYLEYAKNKSPALKRRFSNLTGNLKKQLIVKIIKNDTIFAMHDGWEKPKEAQPDFGESLKLPKPLIVDYRFVFRIEFIKNGDSKK